MMAFYRELSYNFALAGNSYTICTTLMTIDSTCEIVVTTIITVPITLAHTRIDTIWIFRLTFSTFRTKVQIGELTRGTHPFIRLCGFDFAALKALLTTGEIHCIKKTIWSLWNDVKL